jgi:hypothetical protein
LGELIDAGDVASAEPAGSENMRTRSTEAPTIASAEALQVALHGCRSERERFNLRLQFADSCLKSGEKRLALSLFAALGEDIQRFRLEEWNPELCVDVLLRWWKAIKRGSLPAAPRIAGAGLME